MEKKLIVISGCSGGGKSTLLNEFKNNGYQVISEVAREIVKEQKANNGNLTPEKNPLDFCEQLIHKSVIQYQQANIRDQTIFFDRSFLEGISFFQNFAPTHRDKYDYLIHDLRFYPIIFMTPPWQEIYCEDTERKHSFQAAVEEYERLLNFYPKCGYEMVEIPKDNVRARFQYMLHVISNRDKQSKTSAQQ